jgi:hypothetical protein
MSKSPEQVLHSIDLNIPPQLHQEPVLAQLIRDYDLIINFKAAVLDRKATGGGWFTLSLEGHPQTIDHALNYLRNLGVEIFARGSVKIEQPELGGKTDRQQLIQPIDRLVTDYDL